MAQTSAPAFFREFLRSQHLGKLPSIPKSPFLSGKSPIWKCCCKANAPRQPCSGSSAPSTILSSAFPHHSSASQGNENGGVKHNAGASLVFKTPYGSAQTEGRWDGKHKLTSQHWAWKIIWRRIFKKIKIWWMLSYHYSSFLLFSGVQAETI